MKVTQFTITIDYERKWNYMFFDGFLEALIENKLLDKEDIEDGIKILNAAQLGHEPDD